MGNEKELINFQEDLLTDNENIKVEAPISISGETAYS